MYNINVKSEMKKISILAITAVFMAVFGITPCSSQNDKTAVLKSGVDSVSYMIGKANGYQMLNQSKEYLESWPVKGNYEAFIAGLNDAMKDPEDAMFLGRDFDEIGEFINAFFQAAVEKAAAENKAEGEKFLAENKTKSGVITTPSGLQYKVLTQGTGPKPKATDEVKVHYIGKMADSGKVFDSTYERGEPADIPLEIVVEGWSEGLQLMSVGSKYILWIPADLGYGENPTSPDIKPNGVLEFEIELLEIIIKETEELPEN